jgi:hypothetical protein
LDIQFFFTLEIAAENGVMSMIGMHAEAHFFVIVVKTIALQNRTIVDEYI